ncbi:protein-L-isoaspartate O-methyltransferase family protein [Sphingomonas flavalba]|uniref:protein-L-isoaspartate O-methyltransferase family protein n=1 Tax=Sphingomonas flavalba TaxID=2559804 RepID=UPI00109D919F|nr:protein-L-isoaspartate O-methyltransferase [Sphingomonas flavalba]
MTEQNFHAMRQAMVASQLRPNAVDDPRVIAAMDAVPRERFVPAERAAIAYVDTAIRLGDGRALNPPMALGRLLTRAEVAPTDSVLLIGAATGYGAAVLARLAARVVAVEADAALAAQAKAALADAANVAVVTGALAAGHGAGAPYDLIVIDGAVAEVPEALVAQLADDGRLVTGLVEDGVTRLAIGRRGGTGFGLDAFADADTVLLPGFDKPPIFRF